MWWARIKSIHSTISWPDSYQCTKKCARASTNFSRCQNSASLVFVILRESSENNRQKSYQNISSTNRAIATLRQRCAKHSGVSCHGPFHILKLVFVPFLTPAGKWKRCSSFGWFIIETFLARVFVICILNGAERAWRCQPDDGGGRPSMFEKDGVDFFF
jgi:hypothetical protein